MESFIHKLRTLCKIVESGKTLQEILDDSFPVFENPIHVCDMSRHTIAYTQKVSIDHERWIQDVVRDEFTSVTASQMQEVRKIHNESFFHRQPVYVEDKETSFPRYIKTLVGDDSRPVGVLILSALCKPFSPGDSELLDVLSHTVTQMLRLEHPTITEQQRHLDTLLMKLLDGTVNRSINLSQWFNYHQWKLLSNIYVMVIQPDDSSLEPESLDTVIETLSDRPYCRAVIYANSIVYIISRTDSTTKWETDEQELMEQLSNWNMVAGVSRGFSDPFQIHDAFYEAMTALSMGRQYAPPLIRCRTYDAVSAYHLFETLPADMDPIKFCNTKILHLSQADQSKEKELLVTLHTYLRNARNLSKTAEDLLIHRNTVRYRLNKCMDILHSDLEDGEEIFSFLLSLKILEYRKKHRNHYH